MQIDQLASQTIALMNQIAENADAADLDASMRVVQQSTRLLEAVGVRQTEVRHMHFQESNESTRSPA